MDPQSNLSCNTSIIEAAVADSRWTAYIPVVSTHFLKEDNGKIIPNDKQEPCIINLFDFIDSYHLTNSEIQRHMEALDYPLSSKGTKALLCLENYIGDDISVVKSIQKDITQSAMKHSTVLKSTIRRSKR